MGTPQITCKDVRRYYLRDDFLRYLLGVLPKRAVVLCTASEPIGRYQQCRPKLMAGSVDALRSQMIAWLDNAFVGLAPSEVPPVYPSLHYAVCRHWIGGRDLVLEVDADEWQEAWEKVEPVVGIFEALRVPYFLRYSGHVSPHLCVAEEDFPEPATLSEALRSSDEYVTVTQRKLRVHGVGQLGPVARLPYGLNENTGFSCIEVRRDLHGLFEPALAHPDSVDISRAWPPITRSERGLRLIEWARGDCFARTRAVKLFSRSAETPTPPAVHSQADLEAEFKRLRANLLSAMEGHASMNTDVPEVPEGMVYIPAGEFISGSPWDFRELGKPSMKIDRTGNFFIDVAPVTNAQYLEFVRDGGYERKGLWSADGWQFVQACGWRGPSVPLDRHQPDVPVCGVSYFEAEAYARWRGGRLPTWPEWEKACRGRYGPRWPWGDDFDAALCNTADRHESDEDWKPTPVGSFPEGSSPYGCQDMIGNVWEWVQDVVVVGGSFVSHLRDKCCTEHHGQEPNFRPTKVGFRCAMDAEPSM